MKVLVEGRDVRSERDFHRQLAGQLEFGEYYGWNTAALRDRLLTDVPRPVEILWKNSAESRANLGEEVFRELVSILQEAVDQDRTFGLADRFVYQLQ